MKKKLFIALSLMVLMICTLALGVSAEMYATYDTSREVTLSSGDTVPLYDENGYALTYYMSEGALTSQRTVDVVNVDGSGWISYKDNSLVANVVVANLQDTHYKEACGYDAKGLNVSMRDSSNIEYVFLADEVAQFSGWYNFSNCSKLVKFEITENSQLTSFAQYMFYNSPALKEIYIPSGVTQLPGGDSTVGVFSKCTSLSSVTFADDIKLTVLGDASFNSCISLTEIKLPETLEKINLSVFANCTNLASVTIPDGVTSIGQNAFRSSGIINSPFTENSRCKELGYFAFRNCDSLKNMIIPLSLTTVRAEGDYGPFSECDGIEIVTFGTYEEEKMTTIPGSMFSLANIEKIVLPEGIVHIGAYAFASNATLKEISFPNSVQTIAQRACQGCSALETIRFGNSFKHFTNSQEDHGSFSYNSSNIKNIYLPVSFYSEAVDTKYVLSYMFNCGGSNNVKIFYTGTQEQFEQAIANFKSSSFEKADYNATDGNDPLLSTNFVSVSDYLASPESYETGRYMIYGYNACDAFYNGEHTYTSDSCITNCKNCTLTDIVNENGEHDSVYLFSSKSDEYVEMSYLTFIYRICQCQTCKSVSEVENIGTIFTTTGYSYDQVNGDAIMQNFGVDKEVLKKYYVLGGAELSYGLIAANGTINSPDVGGVFLDDVATIDFTNRSYDLMEIKIYGLKNNHQATQLYCCAYIKVGNDIVYIDNGAVVDIPSTRSYNDLAGVQTEPVSLDASVPTNKEQYL